MVDVKNNIYSIYYISFKSLGSYMEYSALDMKCQREHANTA